MKTIEKYLSAFESKFALLAAALLCVFMLSILPTAIWSFSPMAAIMFVGYELGACVMIIRWMEREEEKNGVENE